MSDYISRQAAIDAFDGVKVDEENCTEYDIGYNDGIDFAVSKLSALSPAQPDNQVHLCDSCSYTYPECPSVYTDVIFGNGIGNDNICACSKYLPSAQPEIIYCKDCRKHNHAHGYYHDGTFIGIMDCCPLIEIRGKAQGHEFDYQYCVYGKRKDTC